MIYWLAGLVRKRGIGMNRCMEIQAQITDYIDGTMTPDRLEGFVGHIHSCEECREELNIYYTLYLGILQLEHEEEEVKELYDLDGALAEELYHSECQIRRRHFFQGLRYVIYTTAFWCIVLAALLQLRIFADMGMI